MKRLSVLLSIALAVLTLEAAVVAAAPREDFVQGLYREVLGRTPDPQGTADWSSFLEGHCDAQGFGAVAHGFLDSDEFRLVRPLSLPGLVTLLYRTFLARDPDAAAMSAWSGALRAARLDVATGGFLGSREFHDLLPDRTDRAAVARVVQRFYEQILGRGPDPAGLKAWVDHIVRTRDLGGVAAGFLTSKEFEATPMTLRDFVTILYRALLGREPDPAGLDAWEAVLRAHLMWLVDAGFLPSDEFTKHRNDVCENRIAGFEAALVRCEDVLQPVALSDCGLDPLTAGRVEINDHPEENTVEVKVRGALPDASYAVVHRSLTGEAATERTIGTLTTDAAGDGTLEVDDAFALGDTGAGSVVLRRNDKDQFVSGFKVDGFASAELEAVLVRCEEVNQPTALDDCGTDPLKKGRAEIDLAGDVDVKVVHATPSTVYTVVFRSLTGDRATERVIGTLATNPAGNGKLMLRNFFLPGDIGAGNLVLERSGMDQFMTGFRVVVHGDDDVDDEN